VSITFCTAAQVIGTFEVTAVPKNESKRLSIVSLRTPGGRLVIVGFPIARDVRLSGSIIVARPTAEVRTALSRPSRSRFNAKTNPVGRSD
jgi:hypothetical protein